MRSSAQQIAHLERITAYVLECGLGASAAILAVGLLMWAVGAEPWATSVLQTGLIVLMATPAARVLVALIEYAYVRDWFFVATAATVLALLAASFLTAWLTR